MEEEEEKQNVPSGFNPKRRGSAGGSSLLLPSFSSKKSAGGSNKSTFSRMGKKVSMDSSGSGISESDMHDVHSMADSSDGQKFSPNKFIEFDDSGNAIVNDRFNFFNMDLAQSTFEGIGILKTKNGHAREYWVEISDYDIYFFKQKGAAIKEFMHQLKGLSVKRKEPAMFEGVDHQLFPVKIVISVNKARVIYFHSEPERDRWYDKLKEVSGCCNVDEYYNQIKELGKGHFGVVYLSEHKKTKEKVAIKCVKKQLMTASEMA